MFDGHNLFSDKTATYGKCWGIREYLDSRHLPLVVIGQDCVDGEPVFPPVGLKDNQLDPIQRELLGYCNLIQPTYFPILSVERYDLPHEKWTRF